MFFHRFFNAPHRFVPLQKKHSTTSEHKEPANDPNENLKDIKKALGNPADLFWRRLEDGEKTAAVILYFETLVDSDLLGRQVIEPLKPAAEGADPLSAGLFLNHASFQRD